MSIIIVIVIVAIVVWIIIADNITQEEDKRAGMTMEDKLKEAQKNQELFYGQINNAMKCPHCQTNGKIRTKHIIQKKGISGGKAVATVLTGGLSVLAVGLSRKEGATQAYCENCKNTWHF